jgi:hypothetical protein
MANNSDSEDGNAFGITEELVQSPVHRPAGTSSIDFGGLLQPGLELHENLANGNGGQAWPAGIVLAKYLLRRKRDDLKDCSMSVRRPFQWHSKCTSKEKWRADSLVALSSAQDLAW